ncbi:MAG: hypothetical protein VCF24_14920 [Candidatus Latescibacterota bacterium]
MLKEPRRGRLSMPVGFKNSTAGDLQVAVEAIESARHRHSFLGIDAQGGTAVVRTEGNPLGHLVLRGGADGPNYHPDQLSAAAALMRTAGTRRPAIIVDCSHANSGKKHVRQEGVWQSVLQQRIEGNDTIVGLMVESHLEEGNQKLGKDGTTGLATAYRSPTSASAGRRPSACCAPPTMSWEARWRKGPRDQEAVVMSDRNRLEGQGEVVMRRSTSVFSTSSTSS